MSKIRIIKIPQGWTPAAIREQWVDVEIPLGKEGSPNGIWFGNSNQGGYVVSGKNAVAALRAAGRQEAADFWEQNGFLSLRFSTDVCQLIESVKAE